MEWHIEGIASAEKFFMMAAARWESRWWHWPPGQSLKQSHNTRLCGGGTGPWLGFLPQVLPCADLVFLDFEVSSVACNQEPCRCNGRIFFPPTGEFYKVLLKKKKKVVLIQKNPHSRHRVREVTEAIHCEVVFRKEESRVKAKIGRCKDEMKQTKMLYEINLNISA